MNPVVLGPSSLLAKKSSPPNSSLQCDDSPLPFMCTAIPRDPRHFLCIELADEFHRSTYSGLNSHLQKKKKKKRAAVSFSCAVKLARPPTVTVALILFFLHISPPAEPLIYLKQNGLSYQCDTLHNIIFVVGGGQRAKRCSKKLHGHLWELVLQEITV